MVWAMSVVFSFAFQVLRQLLCPEFWAKQLLHYLESDSSKSDGKAFLILLRLIWNMDTRRGGAGAAGAGLS